MLKEDHEYEFKLPQDVNGPRGSVWSYFPLLE